MTISRSLPQAERLPERCCRGKCEYRPEAVRHHLAVIRAMEARGEDPGQRSASPRYGLEGGGTSTDGPAVIWDIQQAMKALRTEGREVTDRSVAERLCPFAIEDC